MKITRRAYETLMKGGFTTVFMGLMHMVGVAIYATTGWAVDPIPWYANAGVAVVAGLVMVITGAMIVGICDVFKPEDEPV